MGLTDIYRYFLAKEAKYTFFSNAHETFSKTDNMTGCKTSLNKYKKREISNISYYNGLKLKTNLKEKTQKQSNSWRMNNVIKQ